MKNRTAIPINTDDARTMRQYTEPFITRTAYLGNEEGYVAVASNSEVNTTDDFGMYWIRFPEGNDLQGNTVLGKAQKARISDTINLLPEWRDIPVKVRYSRADGEWEILSVDGKELRKAGMDTRSLNPFRQFNALKFRDLHNGQLFAPALLNSGEQRIIVEEYLSHWKQDNSLYNFGSPLSDNNSFATYIPSVGNERIVLIAHNWVTLELQYVASATRTISTASYTLSDIQALFVQLEDMTSPLGLVKLGNNQGTVTQEDIIADFRQLINAPQIRGNRNEIDIPVHVLIKNEFCIHGQLLVTNRLTIEGKVLVL